MKTNMPRSTLLDAAIFSASLMFAALGSALLLIPSCGTLLPALTPSSRHHASENLFTLMPFAIHTAPINPGESWAEHPGRDDPRCQVLLQNLQRLDVLDEKFMFKKHTRIRHGIGKVEGNHHYLWCVSWRD